MTDETRAWGYRGRIGEPNLELTRRIAAMRRGGLGIPIATGDQLTPAELAKLAASARAGSVHAIPDGAELSITTRLWHPGDNPAQWYFDRMAADPRPWSIDDANLLPRAVLENRTILQFPRVPVGRSEFSDRLERLLADIPLPVTPYPWRPYMTGHIRPDPAPWARRRAMGIPQYEHHPEPPPAREPAALVGLIVFLAALAALFLTIWIVTL